MAAKLAHQTQRTAGIPNGLRTGTVAAVGGGGLVQVTVAGGSVNAGIISSYAPRVGDQVSVFRQDSSWLVLGPVQGTASWTRLSALGYQNGWTDRSAAFPPGQVRVTATEAQLMGELNTGTITNGTVIVTLPAAATPPAEVVLVASIGTARVRLTVDSSGALKIFDAGAGGVLQMCLTYPLDFIASF